MPIVLLPIFEALEIQALVNLALPQEELIPKNTAWLSKSVTSQPSMTGPQK